MSPARYRDLDARSLRGIAHPLRVRILVLLRLDGPATATSLAKRLGELTGTMSWHLRQLATHGFIEEAVDRGNRRDRWWRAASDNVSLNAGAFLDDSDLAGPTSLVLHELMNEGFQRATRFMSEEWPRAWREAWLFSDWDDLHLTPPRLQQLKEELCAVVERYRAEPDPAPDPAVHASHGATTTSDAGTGTDHRPERIILQMQGFPYRSAHRDTPPPD